MIAKLTALLSSVRFWSVTLIYALAIYKGIDPVTATQGWLGIVTVIGTLDSVGQSFSGTK